VRDVWAPHALRWTFSLFIAWSSIQTLLTAHDAHGHALALIELAALAAFQFERTAIYACAVLLAVFTIAAVATAIGGAMPLRFFYFAATALCLVTLRRGAPAFR
jgi:hypothetical protein